MLSEVGPHWFRLTWMNTKNKPDMTQSSWWKGVRGEWYVIAQGGLFLLVVFGPRTWHGLPGWSVPSMWFGSVTGSISLILGGVLSTMGSLKLGANLTALPYPKDGSILIEVGPYRWVRHPIYGGVILAAFGWGLWVHSWLTLGYALILLIFLDIKSRREEQWLRDIFPDYINYQKRVRKLIPFIY